VPQIRLTLIESQTKKATFLREVIRALDLENADVFCGRAERWQQTAGVVTLRAVEQFARVLPAAAALVREQGLLGLLIGEAQIEIAHKITPVQWKWSEPVAIPKSAARRIVIAERLT
jgi:16S rRNA G527 N7-methylase RsmG